MSRLLSASDFKRELQEILELLDEERLVVADVVVGARDPVEDVGKARQIPRLLRIEPGQRPLDTRYDAWRDRAAVRAWR